MMITKNPKIIKTPVLEVAVSGKKRKSVSWMGLQVIVYSAILIGILFITLLDAQQPVLINRFSEQSYTEYAQEFALLFAVLFLYGSAWLFPKQSVVAYLLGGFLGMAYIREFDSWLDNNVADGAWQVMAYSLAACTAYLVYQQKAHLWPQLASFIKTRAFGIIITGMLIVFIYSRLYSDKHIWMAAMGEENYMYVITRASEEAIELLGYTLILLGTIDYFSFLKKKQTRKLHHKRRKQLKYLVNPLTNTSSGVEVALPNS